MQRPAAGVLQNAGLGGNPKLGGLSLSKSISWRSAMSTLQKEGLLFSEPTTQAKKCERAPFPMNGAVESAGKKAVATHACKCCAEAREKITIGGARFIFATSGARLPIV